MRTHSIVCFSACLGLLVAACGGTPKPTESLAASEAALRAANEVGADQYPQSQLHAKLAQEQLTQAQKLVEDGDNEEAASLLERAKADAELALALARKAAAEQASRAATGQAGMK